MSIIFLVTFSFERQLQYTVYKSLHKIFLPGVCLVETDVDVVVDTVEYVVGFVIVVVWLVEGCVALVLIVGWLSVPATERAVVRVKVNVSDDDIDLVVGKRGIDA